MEGKGYGLFLFQSPHNFSTRQKPMLALYLIDEYNNASIIIIADTYITLTVYWVLIETL